LPGSSADVHISISLHDVEQEGLWKLKFQEVKEALVPLVEAELEQILVALDTYEEKEFIDTEYFVDTELRTVYIRTCQRGNCWAMSCAIRSVACAYREWLDYNNVVSGHNLKIANAAGSHCAADYAFYMPPRKPSRHDPCDSVLPQLALEVEFRDREHLVSSRLQRFYWQPAFFGVDGTRVNEVWGLFLPTKEEYYEIKAAVQETQAAEELGPLVQAQHAATAVRPEGFYLVIYTQTHPDALYALTPGMSFAPPVYSVFAAAPAICVTAFLQGICSGRG
jgi:hypothetical protein